MNTKKNSAFFLLLLCISVLLFGCASSGSNAEQTTQAVTEPPAEETAATDDGAVHVANVDELLAAIASDTEIVLAPGEYDLAEAKNYGRIGGKNYHWEEVPGGYELVLTNLHNLTIRGTDPYEVTISAEPRYADVLHFEGCVDLRILDVTCGHTKEPGVCAGGVLLYDRCADVSIERVRLYGCGVRGLELNGCVYVTLDCSDVFECSEGCVYMEDSSNVVLKNSKFFDCKLWGGVFEIYGSKDIAVINSEIYGNEGIYPEYGNGNLVRSNCPGVYFGGLDVHNNQFVTHFLSENSPVTVEKCRFDHWSGSWASDLYPVDAEGNTLSDDTLANMSMRYVNWEAAQGQKGNRLMPDADGKVHVSSVDEFLSAIGDNVTIYLEPGIYDLSEASNYGGYGSRFYHWMKCADGSELAIMGVKGMSIEGAGVDLVTIQTAPRHANVLRFDDASDLHLSGFRAGHTTEPGLCSGGVIQLNSTQHADISDCSLYGCGILGIWAADTKELRVRNTEIYECSSGAAWFYSCSDAELTDCNIHDIEGRVFYADYFCRNIFVDGKEIEG